MKTALTLVFIVAIAGCAAMGMNTMPPASELVASGYADSSETESLEQGRILIVTECTECHRIYWPSEFAPTVWPEILGDMGKRASLEPDGADAILRYYVAASRRVSETP